MLAATVLRGVERQGVSAFRRNLLRHMSCMQQQQSDLKSSSPLMSRRVAPSVMQVQRTAGTSAIPAPHSKTFMLERYWAAGMMPLLPMAYFVHHPVMDFALAIGIGMHVHWGLHGVVSDYARPYVIGESMAKAAHIIQYIFTALMLAAFLAFNFNDVGITKAFEMAWSL